MQALIETEFERGVVDEEEEDEDFFGKGNSSVYAVETNTDLI